MDENRQEEVNAALIRGGGMLLALCAVIAIGTFLMVKMLGLDEGGTTQASDATPARTPLPTTALPSKEDASTPAPTASPSASPTSEAASEAGINLVASPVSVRPMERVNLTGTMQGADNLQLQVQRFENGQWSDFPVNATVHVGNFQTYVQTGRLGDQKFRVKDPASGMLSNEVTVTIQ